MHCPNCHFMLSKKELASIEVDHCENCGGTLFDINEINRITLEEARNLADERDSDIISGYEKYSPRDQSPLKQIKDSSVPYDVTLLKSDTTGEVFAFPDDLVRFKEAQESKIGYFKTWHMPLDSVKSVLILSFVFMSTAAIGYLASQLSFNRSTTSQAANMCINNVQLISNERNYIVSCRTKNDLLCNIESECNGERQNNVFDEAPTRMHLWSFEKGCSRIKIICKDDEGSSTSSDWIQLQKLK